MKATILAIKERAFWPKMSRDITRFYKNCGPCRRARHQTNIHAGQYRTQLFRNKCDTYGIDLVGKFNEVDGFNYVLHCICWATGFNWTIPVPNKQADTIATALLEKVFLLYGFPKTLYSDRGGEFVNAILDQLTKALNVQHNKTCAWSPQGNARTENRHRQYNYIMKILCNEYAMSWPKAILFANWAINCRPWAGTDHSPYELMFGRKPRQPFDHNLADGEPVDMTDAELLRSCEAYANNCLAMVEDAIVCSQRLNRFRASEVLRSIVYYPGDLVLMHIPRVKKGITTRLRYQTTGPFEVQPHASHVTPNSDGSYNTYRVRHLGSGQETTANVRQILPCISKTAHLQDAHNTDFATPPVVPPFDPHPGSFVLLPNEGGVPYHLLKVLTRDDRIVHAQFLNTNDTQRLKRFRLCWQHDSKPEIQSNRQHNAHGYRAWADDFAIDELCQLEVQPTKIGATPSGNWFNLRKTAVAKALATPPY